MERRNVFYRVFMFYKEGFQSKTLGRTLWAIILIKLFIMFAVLKLFFFPSVLGQYDTDEEKCEQVIKNFTTVNQEDYAADYD
ncbi:MAG: DUF4492 domain-containing protein [Rikenellaceae bacterium]|nr:DUF4492 domain-containing protein [Rikenellaceae bacterium]